MGGGERDGMVSSDLLAEKRAQFFFGQLAGCDATATSQALL